MEAEILGEIKEAEQRADEVIERAKREKEAIISKAIADSAKLIADKKEEIRKSQEKKLMEFREKAKLIKEERLAEGKIAVKQLKAKAEKNIPKAVDFVMKKFEEMI